MKRNRRFLPRLAKTAPLALVVMGLLSVQVGAEDRKQATDERAAKDAQQREAYLRAVPPGGLPVELEDDMVKMRTLRNWHLLTYPTGRMPADALGKAREHVRKNVQDAPAWQNGALRIGGQLSTKATVNPNENTWTEVGPTPLDSIGTTNNAFTYGRVGGRVSAGGLAVDPNNTNVAYAGFAAGGLWKTTNLSASDPTWVPLWDDKDFVTQAAGAIEIDPTNSSIVYVGTGDWAASDQFSAGIMKTTDAGATWTQLGADIFTPFSQTLPAGGNRWSNQNLKVIEVDPKDNQTVLAGTRYDLYLSNDGGSSWQICAFGNNYTNPGGSGTAGPINRISGMYLDDRGASTIAYVAVGFPTNTNNGNNGVYRFTIPASGCPSWPSDYTTLFGGFPSSTGNGTNGSSTGRIELAGSQANGLTLYAEVSDAVNRDREGTYVLRPDSSSTWTQLGGALSGCSSTRTNQDWYDLFIAVDPTNDKRIFTGHIDVFGGTVNGGYTSAPQTNITDVYGTSCSNYGKVHPDQHAFAWIGNTGDFLVGNDGGVYKNTTGTGNGWSDVNGSFNTLQFYAGQIGADFAGNGQGGVQWLFGGMQDNGNASWSSATSDLEWTARSVGGDGFFTSFDPVAGSLTGGRWMTEYVYGDMSISTSGADGPYGSTCEPNYTGSADWSTPFMIDTLHCDNNSCDKYIVGEDYVWVAGAYSGNCPSWSRVSGSLVKTGDGSILTVGLAPSEPKAAAAGTSDGKVWWSGNAWNGGNCTQSAANSASFSCSPNTGASWIDADASNSTLPNRAVLQVAFDPDNHNVFYAAVGGFDDNTPSTPGHVFQMTSNGSSISVANKTGNLPDVPAWSVAVNPHDRQQVFVGTEFGFYYTDDIDASSPTWVRYQDGLPNTVIRYLTIDRGPASDPIKGTTLAAFTYGRGIYLLKLQQPAFNNPPSVNISAPANGSSADVGTSVSFTGTATDTEDGTLTGSLSWSSSIDGTIGSGGSFSTASLSLGSHTITASVTDSGGKVGDDTITLNVVDPNSNGPQNAAYDGGLGAPACAIAGSSCDSGALLDGRNTNGPEPNQPNTLDACTDGGSGSYHSDESNDRIVVSTLDNSDFTEGATVRIDATVWAWTTPSADSLDLYYAADANSPTWTFIATLQPGAAGAQTLSTTYTLPSGTLQAVRANFRYQGNASSCSGGNYDDADDLVFAVKAAGGNTAPSVTISAPANPTTVTQGDSVTFTGTANDTEDGDLTASISWSSNLDGAIGTGGSFATTSLSTGTHTVTASVTDSGSLSDSDTVTVTVNAPANNAPTVTISSPADPTTVTQGASVTFTGTANDTEDGDLTASISWSSNLDGAIGSGGSFATSALSAGTHTVTASVTDSGSLSGSDTVTVTVTPPTNNAPTVSITTPTGPTTVTDGDSVSFAGTASDTEDGDLTGSIAWSSNLDGSIGTGGSFATTTLSVGSHTITASVTDSGSLTATDTVSVTVQSAGGCTGCIDWSTTTTVSYSNQDSSASVAVEDGGDTLLLTDNTWRRTSQTFNVTANTVIEVEFQSTAQGEIHGIGFDEDDTLTNDVRIFQLHGTQNWGSANHDFDNYSGTAFTTYTIPVGQYYTGSAMYLVLVNDNDAGSGNNSRFRNVRVYEDTPPPGTCAAEVDFESGAAGWTNDTGASTCSTGSFIVGAPSQQTNGGVTTQVGGDHTPSGTDAFYSASNSSAGNADVDGGNCVVTSPVYAVTEASDVSIWYFHGQRDSGGDPSGDFFLLEMSTNGGSTWTTIASNGDTSSNAVWTEATATAGAGTNVQFRVQVSDGTASGDLVEAGVDDLSICPQ